MDDIFKSKDDEQREEKINNLFRSDIDFKKTELPIVPKKEAVVEPEKKGRNFFLVILLILLFWGISSTAGYFYWQYKKIAQNPPIAPVVDEAAVIAEKIKNLADLPTEKPVLATIANPSESAGQSLFPDALEGDKVLIYLQAKKAILYRPDSDQVVKTISLLSDQLAETAETNSMENAEKIPEKIATKVKVDVLNGTEIKGLAKETADKLAGMENVELAKVGNAQKSTYTKILVVDLSGKNAIAAKIIAGKVSGEVGTLPTGETKGIADILIIAGK